MTELHAITGAGQRSNEVAGEMADRIEDVIRDYGDRGIPIATVIGVLEIVKQEILRDAED